MTGSNRDRVFISYAKEDLGKIRDIYNGLKKRGLNVWFDKEHLQLGAWKPQIEKAICKSRYFVICISEAALRKTGDERPGFQDEELNWAYNIAERQSDQDFSIVPVRIEECGRGDFRLSSFQQYDLFKDFEKDLDKLAVHLGGFSLSDSTAKDERTEDEKTIAHLMGKAEAADFAAEYNKAIAILNSVLALKPDSSVALSNLGSVLNAKGEYDKAIEYYEKALKFDIKTFGKDHSNVAAYWSNLGEAWRAKGEYDKAIEYFDKALKSDIKTFGKDHSNIATYWNNLGEAWRAKGKYDKAIEYFDKALKSDIKTFGEDHPNVARDWNNLGLAWKEKDKYDKAIEYYVKALKSDIKTFGKDHPYVALYWNNLGEAWRAKGECDKAIEYFDKALKSDIKTFGKDHPNVATSWNNLGGAWEHKGEYDKAIEYFEKALKSSIKTFSEDHPRVATTWNNLGWAWESKGEYDKAIELYEKALESFKKAGLLHYAEKTEAHLKLTREQRNERKK